MSSSTTAKSSPVSARPTPPAGGYLHQSELPLTSLVFVLPFLVIYELGTHTFADPYAYPQLVAFRLMRDFFGLFGATGQYLPALAVVGILLAWHIARNDPWRVRASTLVGMFAESVFLSIPLIFVCLALASYLPLAGGDLGGKAIMSLGAGIYEELIFRLCAMTLMHLALIDLLKMQRPIAICLILVLPAVLFSLYHYLGDETFAMGSFVFRTVAGIYFGIIFLVRGFGITAGAHAAYDIWIVLLVIWNGR